jgi:two-component sensor histidine kinase
MQFNHAKMRKNIVSQGNLQSIPKKQYRYRRWDWTWKPIETISVDGLTTKGTNQENGTGLGLIICKEFIEKNNGTIKVDSTPGMGTTFTIELKNNISNNDKKNTQV